MRIKWRLAFIILIIDEYEKLEFLTQLVNVAKSTVCFSEFSTVLVVRGNFGGFI